LAAEENRFYVSDEHGGTGRLTPPARHLRNHLAFGDAE
jgi:hypothetical protein